MSNGNQTVEFSVLDQLVYVNPTSEIMKVDDSEKVWKTTKRSRKMKKVREGLDNLNNLLKITWKHALIFIALSYLVNIIFFWALNDAGRKTFSRVTFCFARLHALLPVQFFLGSLVFLAIGRWFQAYQTLLPGTNKLMRYYSSSLKPNKLDDVMWPDNRQRMIRKWNDWVLLAWLLTVRVISTPLRRQYPTIEVIKAKGLMTEIEYQSITNEQNNKKLKNNELSLVVYEWLVLLNETSDYRITNDFKANFDAIQSLKKSGSNLIKFSGKNIPQMMILAATLAVHIYGITSILGHNVIEFDPLGTITTSSIVGAFLYPLVYAIPYLLFCVWLRYLRSTTDPFGWDDDDIDVCEIFKHHVENAQRFCYKPGAELTIVIDQVI